MTSGKGAACGGRSQGRTWTVKRGRDTQQARGIVEGAEQTGNRQDKKSVATKTERDEGQAEGNKTRRRRRWKGMLGAMVEEKRV